MTTTMKKKLLSALVAFTCSFSVTQANAEDLMQVYEIALANDPVVLKAKATRDAQDYNTDIAMAALLPQIGATMGYEKTDGDLRDPDVFSRGIRLDQDLFNLRSWKSLNIAEKQALQADASYQLAQQNLIVRVSNAYFNVLARQDDLEFVRAEKRALERQLEQTKQRHAVGLTAITDVHEAQAQYDNAVAREIVAINENTGDFLPFQELMHRRRKYKIEKAVTEYPITVNFFDLLYCNGKDCTNLKYIERRRKLENIIEEK